MSAHSDFSIVAHVFFFGAKELSGMIVPFTKIIERRFDSRKYIKPTENLPAYRILARKIKTL